MLLTRSYDGPPTWQQLFDDLSSEFIKKLVVLFDALSAGAQEQYARRYGALSAV